MRRDSPMIIHDPIESMRGEVRRLGAAVEQADNRSRLRAQALGWQVLAAAGFIFPGVTAAPRESWALILAAGMLAVAIYCPWQGPRDRMPKLAPRENDPLLPITEDIPRPVVPPPGQPVPTP